MLRWALGFFIIAVIAAAFGFLGIATAAVGVAKLLFFVFLILFLGVFDRRLGWTDANNLVRVGVTRSHTMAGRVTDHETNFI